MQEPYKKMFSPLFIDLINERLLKMSDSEEEKEYPLRPGVMNGHENYGFILIASEDGNNYVQEFETEERIAGLSIEDEKLLVFEEGKMVPWIFEHDGRLSNEAKFHARYRSDREYYLEKYGTSLEENPEAIKKTLS